jgi:integrase
LAKLLGHTDLQTTQRYIDGADPTVRTDFLEAMQQVAQLSASSLKQTSDRPTAASFVASQPDQRPDPVALVDALSHLATDLPDWLAQEIRAHTLRRIPRWQPHRAKNQSHILFSSLCRIGRWLVTERNWQQLDQLRRVDLVVYVNARQQAGFKASGIASQLTIFRTFWRDLLEQEKVTNGAVLQVKAPPAGDHLPRYLTPTQFQRLEQVILTETQADRAKDRFNLTWFYLFAHAGLRFTFERSPQLTISRLRFE